MLYSPLPLELARGCLPVQGMMGSEQHLPGAEGGRLEEDRPETELGEIQNFPGELYVSHVCVCVWGGETDRDREIHRVRERDTHTERHRDRDKRIGKRLQHTKLQVMQEVLNNNCYNSSNSYSSHGLRHYMLYVDLHFLQ